MSFSNHKRASMTTSASYSGSASPRRQSSYGHIMAGTGGLPSTHTAAIKTSIAAAAAAAASANAHGNNTKRLSGLHLLNPLQHSQHRNQSLKAHIARTCPSLIHGSPRRKRNMLIMICAGGIVVLIYFLSGWDIRFSASSMLEQSFTSTSSQPQQRSSEGSSRHNNGDTTLLKQRIVYKNPDGTDMEPKLIFMVRDFGAPHCKEILAEQEHSLSKDVRQERDQLRVQQWDSTSRQDAYTLSLTWKRSLKQILPNWKDYSSGWVGQGVVLGAFTDGDGKDTTANMLVQLKLIRSTSSVPVEVWFERADDVSEDLHESIASWGATIRSLDEDASAVSDAIVQSPDEDATQGSLTTPITSAGIQEFKSRAGRNLGQLQKVMTLAALINSGFEDIIYFSPSTLPLQSPRVIFQRPEYLKTGAIFWQHPTSFSAYDSPIWPIIQGDCNPDIFEQSWSSFALRHKDSWKGLFLAWYWLTGPEHATYERIFGQQSHDLLRAAWIAVDRPYRIIDRMPQAGLLDLSRSKGDGIGCNSGSTLYPTPGADVLENPKKFAQDQKRQQKLFQQSYRYGDHAEFFLENQDVMMMDTSMESSLVHSGSNDRSVHKALEVALNAHRDPSRLVMTDAYSAGSEGRVCLKISRKLKARYSE